MERRIELHEKLVSFLGSNNVYFQPPENIQLKYPCIIYKRSRNVPKHADDRMYFFMRGYSGIIIDKNPDTDIPDRILELQYCSMGTPYISDNLYHYPFTIYH